MVKGRFTVVNYNGLGAVATIRQHHSLSDDFGLIRICLDFRATVFFILLKRVDR